MFYLGEALSVVPDEPDLCQLCTQIWRTFVPLTIAAEVVCHISLLPVIPSSSMEAPGAASGVLFLVEHPKSSLHLLFLKVFHHTILPPPLQAFDMVSRLDKLRVCHNEALPDQEPGTPSLGPRVSPGTSPSPRTRS